MCACVCLHVFNVCKYILYSEISCLAFENKFCKAHSHSYFMMFHLNYVKPRSSPSLNCNENYLMKSKWNVVRCAHFRAQSTLYIVLAVTRWHSVLTRCLALRILLPLPLSKTRFYYESAKTTLMEHYKL